MVARRPCTIVSLGGSNRRICLTAVPGQPRHRPVRVKLCAETEDRQTDRQAEGTCAEQGRGALLPAGAQTLVVNVCAVAAACVLDVYLRIAHCRWLQPWDDCRQSKAVAATSNVPVCWQTLTLPSSCQISAWLRDSTLLSKMALSAAVLQLALFGTDLPTL